MLNLFLLFHRSNSLIKLSLAFLFLFFSSKAFSQNDLLNMLNENSQKEKVYTQATFKASRLINGQTIETLPKNHLDFSSVWSGQQWLFGQLFRFG